MTTYRIERRDDLLIVHDPIPIGDMVALTASAPKGDIACYLCANAMGVVFVAGPPAAINAERERLGIEERLDAADR
jgi:hypothetical protein